MYIVAKTLDDLLRRVYPRILKSKLQKGANRGDNREIRGALLRIKNPRARLSRSETRGRIFSGIGELLWYLSGSDLLEYIIPYVKEYSNNSDDGVTIHGAYGPRLLNKKTADQAESINQINGIIKLLKESPSSRRAVIQLFDAADLLPPRKKEIPCTCILQFMVRGKKLDLHVHMRSNDAFWGLPHDVFCFTMIQEIIARSLNIELGDYIHSVGSLHIYTDFEEKVNLYLAEGWQSTKAMSPMPKGDPWPSLRKLLEIERQSRNTDNNYFSHQGLDDYWADLARLIQIFHVVDKSKITEIKRLMKDKFYNAYVSKRSASNLKKISCDK